MKFNFKPVTILFFVAVVIVSINVFLAREKVLYGGDEIISYLCATANQENYSAVLQNKYPYGTISTAAQWKNLLTVNEAFAYRKIAADLSHSDLHPPLYFWILHIWIMFFGMHSYTGILLNMLFQLLSIWPLYKLGCILLNHKIKAAYSTLIWSMTPAIICGVLPFARPYMMLSFVHICYALAFFSFLKKPERINKTGLLLCTCVALLVHFSFITTAICYLSVGFIYCYRKNYRPLFFLIASGIIALLVLWMVHPLFYNSFVLQRERASFFDVHQLLARSGKTALCFIQFVFPVLLLKTWLLKLGQPMLNAVCLLGVISLLALSFIYKNALRRLLNMVSISLRDNIFIVTCLFISLSVIVPYLLYIFPFHAMGGQYLITVYPYWAMGCVTIIYYFKSTIRHFLVCVFCLGTILCLISFYTKQNAYALMISDIQKKELIIFNDTDRRSFPRLIPYLNPNQLVLMINDGDKNRDSLISVAEKRFPLFIFINSIQTNNIKQVTYRAAGETSFDLEDGILWKIKAN